MLLSLPYCELNSSTRCTNCVMSTSLVWSAWPSYSCSRSSLVMVDDMRFLAFEPLPITSSIDEVDDEDDVEMVRNNSLFMLLNIFSHYRRIRRRDQKSALASERASERARKRAHRIWLLDFRRAACKFLYYNVTIARGHRDTLFYALNAASVFAGLLFFCLSCCLPILDGVRRFLDTVGARCGSSSHICASNGAHRTHEQKTVWLYTFALLSNCSRNAYFGIDVVFFFCCVSSGPQLAYKHHKSHSPNHLGRVERLQTL